MTHPIRAQIMGKNLHPQNDHKIEYQLRSMNGRIVTSFSKRDTADEYIRNQNQKHGERAPKLELFRVTTITEKL